jgi:hypothetical protein
VNRRDPTSANSGSKSEILGHKNGGITTHYSARELRELLEALYKDCGLKGLTDRSRRPYRHANRLPFQIEKLIVQLKRQRPSWGAPKIREKLRRLHSEVQTPAISTVHAVTLPSKYPKREHRE